MAIIYETDIAKFRPETQPSFSDKFNSVNKKSRRPSNQQISPVKCVENVSEGLVKLILAK